MFVYTTQLVVKPVVKPVWQLVVSCIQTFNRLSNPLSCQTCLTTVLTTGCIVYTVGCQTRLTSGWTNSHCSFNTVMKPCLSNRLYNPVWQPQIRFDNHVEPTAVRSTRLSNRVCQTGLTNTVWQLVERTTLVERTVLFVQHGCQTGCQTAVSCIQTFNRLSKRFDNRPDNWLDVCLHDTAGCQTGCTTGPVVQPVVSCKRGFRGITTESQYIPVLSLCVLVCGWVPAEVSLSPFPVVASSLSLTPTTRSASHRHLCTGRFKQTWHSRITTQNSTDHHSLRTHAKTKPHW